MSVSRISFSLDLLQQWNLLADKQFSRQSRLDLQSLQCDCSGLFNLLFARLDLPMPFALERPKAVHYYAVLQEVGSSHISTLGAGSLMAWRKDVLPKSGDTGHVLLACEPPVAQDKTRYRLSVYDATKTCGGLSRRDILLHTNEGGQLIGVQLHPEEPKVKRTSIYHAPIGGGRACFGCALPKRVCMCGHVTPDMTPPPITILRHPSERGRTLSTVSLMKQRYPSLLVKDGEVFSPPRVKDKVLLFPDLPSGKDVSSKNEANGQERSALSAAPHYLLLDATWRKAKKLMHLNPWLSGLPRRELETRDVSKYLIRKVPAKGALSSVEAVAAVLRDDHLDKLFERFMNKQVQVMGKSVYRNNYGAHLNYREE